MTVRLRSFGQIRFGLGLIAAFILFGLTPARAEFELCNQTSYILRSSIAYKEKGEFNTKGWWTLYPGQCRTVIQSKLKHKQYYTYAEAAPEHKVGLNFFDGDRSFCVGEKDYEQIGQNDCEANGLRFENFVEVKADNSEKLTTDFIETAEFDLEKARVAGIQRMLTDLGYSPGTIDGFYGKRSQRAVVKFRQDEKIKATNLISDQLLVDLANALRRDTTKLGFNLCNTTSNVIWSAIGYLSENNDWLTRGWWKIEPGTCAKPIRKALKQKEYYIYASTSGLDKDIELTNGDLSLCIADVKFDILGKDNCELRGYHAVTFEKVTTNGADVWTQEISVDTVSKNQAQLADTHPKKNN